MGVWMGVEAGIGVLWSRPDILVIRPNFTAAKAPPPRIIKMTRIQIHFLALLGVTVTSTPMGVCDARWFINFSLR